MPVDFQLETLASMEATAVERVRHYCRDKPVVLAFSYGKDSCAWPELSFREFLTSDNHDLVNARRDA